MALTTHALLGVNILESTKRQQRQHLDIPLSVLGVVRNLDGHTTISRQR